MKPTLLQTVENICLQMLCVLFQFTGTLIDVEALVSSSSVAKNVQRTPVSRVSSSVCSASGSRTAADIMLLSNNPLFAPGQVSFFGCSLPASGIHVTILDKLFHSVVIARVKEKV
ncbi:hypothetical protein IGG59_004390 [Escherichia coli]|uniref:hypothetical protein n=1 Tax=Escherichia coli TaxID=562 RepID=UPI000D1776EE|nr:hypothetical protein [Escherichia coli]EFA4225894.1 hypothetical protein [Escherichia coli O11:H15]EFJ2722308.1 hypothetical protein [Escherichia coli]EGI4366557.1 hypothetical protein [Escherichia coli]EHR8424022.1 hypothetical protein [Escherichia coli]EIE4704829.1 hypothetical protein [Escherichia coli]